MTHTPIEVIEYQTIDGKTPFRSWLFGLRDREARSRILVRLNRVRLGNYGDAHSVGGGVSELRIAYGPGYRVYFGRDGDSLVMLLCGGDKHTQQNDIALARQYWTDYKERSHE